MGVKLVTFIAMAVYVPAEAWEGVRMQMWRSKIAEFGNYCKWEAGQMHVAKDCMCPGS